MSKFERGDIVEYLHDYNNWAREGVVGVVKEYEVTEREQFKDDLVTVELFLSPTKETDDSGNIPPSICFAFRLQKLGHVDV